jgi:hypothetical protein
VILQDFTESIVEDSARAWLEALGYAVLHGPDISLGGDALTPALSQWERDKYSDVVLERRLRQSLVGLNPDLPGQAIPTPDDIFGSAPTISAPSYPNLEGSSPNLTDRRNADGCLLSDQLTLPIINDLAVLVAPLRQQLEVLAGEPRSKGKISRDKMIEVVLGLCAQHFITLRCLAELVNRKPDTLRDQYLSGLVQERKLSLAFPKTPTHERQAYCTSSALSQ